MRVLLCLVILALTACACDGGIRNMSDDWCDHHDTDHWVPRYPYPTHADEVGGSWDQENLKRNDRGCPTAIYIAPNGNLEECQ